MRSGLTPFERRLLSVLPSAGRLGIIGCGGGRELLALSRPGLVVDGLDFSAEAVACARRELARAGLRGAVGLGDAAEEALPGGSYDAILFSWLTYAFIPGRGRRTAALRNAAARLAPEGRALVTFNLRADDRAGPILRLARLAAALARRPAAIGIGDVLHPGGLCEHRFTRPEIESEAREAGLRLERWLPGPPGEPGAYSAALLVI